MNSNWVVLTWQSKMEVIILIKDDIMDVARAIRLSRATMRKIKQNLFWALIYNSGGIPIAAIGLLSPIVAAAAMALSSISGTANSSLLKRLKIANGEEMKVVVPAEKTNDNTTAREMRSHRSR